MYVKQVVSFLIDASCSLTVDQSTSMAHFSTHQPLSASCTSTLVTDLGALNCPHHSLFDAGGMLSGADISSDLDSDNIFGSGMS